MSKNQIKIKMKRALNLTGLVLVKSFIAALGTFAACAIVYAFYLGFFM